MKGNHANFRGNIGPPIAAILFVCVTICFALLLLLTASTSAAQSPGSEPIDDQRRSEEDGESDEDESPYASFDEVEVRRVKPADLPDHRPGLPRASRSTMDSSELPRTLRGEQLQEVTEGVRNATVEIVAVQRPPRPYRATQMVYRGHALWISPDESGENPVLVSTADWLREADELYAVAGDVSHALGRGGLEAGDQRSQKLSDFSAGDADLIEENRDELVALAVVSADRHLNLARLESRDDDELRAPEKGFVLHDMDHVMPGTIFGYSPAAGTSLIPVRYSNPDELEPEYSFYFLVDFAAILGAPIVGPGGDLIAITALRYPTDPARSLAIPPGAIHSFLGTERGEADDRE